MTIKYNEGYQSEGGNKKGLLVALCITAFIMILEFAGGILSNSLALLSDAGHMLSDFASLALTLFALWFASRPVSPHKTYGYYRTEVLAALFNAVTLLGVSALIVYQAVQRFVHPESVGSQTMMVVAAVGLAANVISAFALMKMGDVEGNLNVRSAYLHVLADAFTSIGVIVAGVLIWAFGWTLADPVMSVITTLVICKGAWAVLTRSVHILMEGTPEHITPAAVKEELEALDGVKNVHDLHVWTISSGFDSLSCHLVPEHPDSPYDELLQQATARIEEVFGIRHVTIQIERRDYDAMAYSS